MTRTLSCARFTPTHQLHTNPVEQQVILPIHFFFTFTLVSRNDIAHEREREEVSCLALVALRVALMYPTKLADKQRT
jgi:hypothetical protein